MGQVELVARYDEGHLLLDEALAFVGGQGLGGVQHREPGHLADLVDLRANAGKAGAVGSLVDGEQDVATQDRQSLQIEGIHEEIRQAARARPGGGRGVDSERDLQVRANGSFHAE